MSDRRASAQTRGIAPTMGTDFKSVPGKSGTGPQARGVALITVLLILAILTAVVSRLSFSNRIWLRQVGNGAAFIQSSQATRAVQDWARVILSEDDNDYDSLRDLWAQPLPPLPAGPGFAQGYMEDMQARMNLNNLVDEKGRADREAVRRFKRLLRILDLNPDIAEAAVDWIDADGAVSGPWGAEDGYYLGMKPPYVAANRRFMDAAELRLVRGVGRVEWQKLKPFISALPERATPVNINTASPQVLAAAISEWGAPRQASVEAALWSAKTSKTPFETVNDFYDATGLEYNPNEPPTGLDVRSKFFLAHTRVEIGHVNRRMATLYRRNAERVVVLDHRRVVE